MMNTDHDHNCECLLPQTGCGQAITICFQRHGELFVDNGEYESQVNYCPFCGVKAPLQFDLVPPDKQPSEEDKILAALAEDAKNNPILVDWMQSWQ